MLPRNRRLPIMLAQARFPLVLALFLACVGSSPAQDPGDISLGHVIDENSPTGPVAQTMAELDRYHTKMMKSPPRVWLPPSIPVSNGLWPMGWTGGVDDPSGGAIAQGTRNTLTNMDTLAYTQHVFRERREQRTHQPVCPDCNTKHQ